MRELVLTGYDDNMAFIGDLTSSAMADYALQHNIEFRCERHFTDDSHAPWQKIRIIIEAFESGFDMILWLDADTAITNPKLKWHSKPSGLHVSRDWGVDARPQDFSTGNFVAYSDTLPLWKEALERAHDWSLRPFYEQSAVIELYQELAWAHNLIHIYPRRIFNAVPVESGATAAPWQPGDFLCHMTNLPTHQVRAELFHRLIRGIPSK